MKQDVEGMYPTNLLHTIKVWDVKTADCLHTFKPPPPLRRTLPVKVMYQFIEVSAGASILFQLQSTKLLEHLVKAHKKDVMVATHHPHRNLVAT
ncbi:hypothetical protein SAY87_031641 [Trapa incisa]|uniref:Uncharacterized protein n=1 Tax=Trapa incisa TaxID=236973 RepID=A0AAN7QLC3_9MYRT|nr:hypothetical protein SAY87_031641 [Trapa incisa]